MCIYGMQNLKCICICYDIIIVIAAEAKRKGVITTIVLHVLETR